MLILLFLLAGASSPPVESPFTDRAWTVLKQGLHHSSAYKRTLAVHALGLAGNRTQGMAENALSDSDKAVRAEAALSLLTMHAITAKPKLRACLNDKELEVVLSCANTLYEFKDPAAYEIYYALLTGDLRNRKGMIATQLDTLRDRKQLEKLAFETGIGFVPYGGAAWQAVKRVSQDDASPVRALAAERLALDPQTNTKKALSNYVTDKKSQVRDAVVRAIARRGDPDLLNAVETLLGDADDMVRYDAAAAVIALSTMPAKRNRK